METLVQQLQKAERLAIIAERIGFALWQLQELEGITAQCFVLFAEAKQGMGIDAGNALVEKTQSKPFGKTVGKLKKTTLLSVEIKSRLTDLLAERNWLVHNSRTSSRNAIHSTEAAEQLVVRVDAIADEALALLREFGIIAERFVKQHGVSTQYIDEMSCQILEQWHATKPT